MLKHHFTIALRHIAKHKLFSLINILCIAIGITFSMLIGFYIMDQKQVNHQLKDFDQQYVIKSKWKVKDMGIPITTAGPLPKALKDNYPNLVANYFRYNPVTNVVSAGDRNFKEDIAICDTTMVSMYGFQLLHGNPHQAFVNASSAVITEALAIRLFGTTNALNKTITISTLSSLKQDYLVSAVLKDVPFNSVTGLVDKKGYSVYVPFEGSKYYPFGAGENDWNQIAMVGMVQLKPGVQQKDLATAADKLLATHLPNNLKGLLVADFVPVRSYYLKDNNEAVQKMINTLSMVAFFILLMAIINFTNINIGTSAYRLKEIGLRKVFGSGKKQLVLQYLTESLVLTFVAGLLSVIFYESLRPYFNQILDTSLDPFFTLGITRWALLLSLIVSVGLISGLYPAFVLSSSNIIHSVKGKLDSATGGFTLRKVLLVVQFSLAIIIFVSALNVSRQVSFFFDKNIGYNKDQLLVLTPFPKQWDSTGILHMEALRNNMETVPGVRSASVSFEVPDREPPFTVDLLPEGTKQRVVTRIVVTDENFAHTFGLQVKQGTFFDNYKSSSVKDEIVLNETAARLLGVTTPNKTIRDANGMLFTVAGVVNDFNYSSFQQTIGPAAFVHIRDARQYRFLTFKIGSKNIEQTITAMKERWRKLSPGAPFEYTFMDDRFESLYKSEVQLKKATQMATVLNLVIVFMGVFGIMAFTLARRNKEIAVRKVLGADATNIILLFLKDYAALIVLATLIACPIAWWATHQWLQNYAYRIEQNIVPYIAVFGFLVITTSFFIVIQCYKASHANPVRSLRAE